MEDTIAAIATIVGNSAINIIKISGNKSIEIVEKLFKSKSQKKISELKTYSMIYGNIYDENDLVVDEVLVSVMKSPYSYTREDVVEINCHGGIAAVNKILDLVINSGARLAEPGEFTKRAFLNGRIDLTQVEAIADLIYAKTEASLKIAANNLKGTLSKEIKKIREELLDLIIDIEASIDFTEEDIEIISYNEMLEKSKNISKKLIELIKNEEKGEIVKNGIKIAIVGKPNVGKSSLLNSLIKKDKAIVTHIPGTTRDTVEEILYMDGIPVIITDTAGIRKSKNLIEKIGVDKSINEIQKSDIIIIVIDNSRELTNEDIEIVNKVKEKKHILCINKIDKKSKMERNDLKKFVNEKYIIEVSALKNIGIGKLEEKIKELTIGAERFDFEEKIIVNKRQKIYIQKAKNSIDNAISAIKSKLSQEFPAFDLRNAYNLLGEIIGENINEDILKGIFSKFCVGK